MKDIDIFGNKFQFYHKGDDELKSKFGIVLTILYIICTGVTTYLLGRDFFRRSNPNSSVSSIFTENYEINTLSKSNFSFAFRFEDVNGKPYQNDQRVYVETQVIYMNKSDSNSNKYIHTSPRKCEDDDFLDKAFLKRVNMSTLYCLEIPSNSKLGGYWDSNDFYFLYMSIVRCLPGSTNAKNNKTCEVSENSVDFGDIYFSFYHQRVVFENGNYKNGIYPVLVNKFFNLDINSYKVMNIFTQVFQLNDDKGWIFESKEQLSYFGLSKEELINSNPKAGGLSEAADLFIYSTREKTIYERTYEKISNVIANVGGIVGFFSVIFEYIGNKYSINYFVMNYFKENLIEDNFSLKRKSLSKLDMLDLEKKRSSNLNNINNISLLNENRKNNSNNFVLDKNTNRDAIDFISENKIYKQNNNNNSFIDNNSIELRNNWLKLDSNNKLVNLENKIKTERNIKHNTDENRYEIDHRDRNLKKNKILEDNLNKSNDSLPSRANKLDTSDFKNLDFVSHLKKTIVKNQDFTLYEVEVGFWEPLMMYFNLELSFVLKLFCCYDDKSVKNFNMMYDKFTNTFELGHYIHINSFIKELCNFKEST